MNTMRRRRSGDPLDSGIVRHPAFCAVAELPPLLHGVEPSQNWPEPLRVPSPVNYFRIEDMKMTEEGEVILPGLEPTSSQEQSQQNNVDLSSPGASSSVTSSQGSPSFDCGPTSKKKPKRPEQQYYSPRQRHAGQTVLKSGSSSTPSPAKTPEPVPSRKKPSIIKPVDDLLLRSSEALLNSNTTTSESVCFTDVEDRNCQLSAGSSELESSCVQLPTDSSEVEASCVEVSVMSPKSVSHLSDNLMERISISINSTAADEPEPVRTRLQSRLLQFHEVKKDHTYSEICSEVTEPFIDSHCHLDFIFNKVGGGSMTSWEHSANRLWHNYFCGCVPNFVDPKVFMEGYEYYDPGWIQSQLRERTVLGATYGCHPHYSEDFQDTIREKLVEMLNDRQKHRLVAIGECGLDYLRSEAEPEVQRKVFLTQLELAKEYDVPVVIHCRSGPNDDAEDDCLEVFKEAKISRFHNIHRHCFTGTWSVAEKWLDKFVNVYFGFTSLIAVWEKENKVELLEVLKQLPLTRILLETDAPFFRPRQYESVKTAKNFDRWSLPPMAVNVAFVIARVRNIDVNEVIRATTLNARQMYGLKSYEQRPC